MTSSKVVYPIFEKCKSLTIDPFWMNIFDNCSKRKFPQGMYFFADTLSFEFHIENPIKVIPEKSTIIIRKKAIRNPYSVFRIVKKGLKKMGYVSPIELPNAEFPLFEYNDWSQIKSKGIKEELISKYVDKYHYGKIEKFYEILSLIQTKNILPSDIIMKNGKIEKINIRNVARQNIRIQNTPQQKKKNLISAAAANFLRERMKRIE